MTSLDRINRLLRATPTSLRVDDKAFDSRLRTIRVSVEDNSFFGALIANLVERTQRSAPTSVLVGAYMGAVVGATLGSVMGLVVEMASHALVVLNDSWLKANEKRF